MHAFVMKNSVGIMINADVNVENWLIKVVVIMDLIGIQACVRVSVMNHVMLVNTLIMWIVNAERGLLVN